MADGTLYEGREINIRSTHTESYNASTVGIVLAGNFAINQPTTHKDFNLDLTKDPRDYLYN